MSEGSSAIFAPVQGSLLVDYEAPWPRSHELTMSASELAGLLNVSDRTVRDLAAKAVLVRTATGRYALHASVQGYIGHVRAEAAASTGTATLAAQRAREAKERADRLALQNATARRELIPAAEVEAAWTTILRDVRARMLAVPSRLTQLAGITADDVEREIRAALAEAGTTVS
jgi:phage terminase Nu1 subunit (DNA packaging protein)